MKFGKKTFIFKFIVATAARRKFKIILNFTLIHYYTFYYYTQIPEEVVISKDVVMTSSGIPLSQIFVFRVFFT